EHRAQPVFNHLCRGLPMGARHVWPPVEPPPRTGVCEGQRYKPTAFRKYYERRDLPVVMDYGGRPNSIKWKVDIERIDYHHYLPLFFEGLRETTHPYETLACQGVYDMLDHWRAQDPSCDSSPCAAYQGYPCVRLSGDTAGRAEMERCHQAQCICSFSIASSAVRALTHVEALNTRNHRVMCNMLKVLQRLVTSADGVGEALVPYYRNILPMFNIFKDKKSLDSESGDDVADLVKETLTVMEQHGGQNAFMHIKYMIPTYQSCTRN
ncbi:Parkin coregulated gene-like protein, partial [Oryzias melastigma]